jgi:hypothetical protein
MSETIIVALLSLLGSLGGTLGGIALNSKLSNYRIEQLEKKVDKHNNLIERMFKAEESISLLDEKLRLPTTDLTTSKRKDSVYEKDFHQGMARGGRYQSTENRRTDSGCHDRRDRDDS